MAELADVSEHNGYLPGGQNGYIIRTVSDGGAPRQDYKWRQWHAAAAGHPRGPYGIFYPGRYSAAAWADVFITTLRAVPWEIVPSIDVELGDANLAAVFCSIAVPRINAAGYPVEMGYYSALSAYRQTCARYFDRQWIAIYGSNDGTRHAWPSGAVDMHQYSSNPYDKNYIPDIGRILTGVAPPVEDDLPYTPEQLRKEVYDAVRYLIIADADVHTVLQQNAQHALNSDESGQLLKTAAYYGTESAAVQSDLFHTVVKQLVEEVLRTVGTASVDPAVVAKAVEDAIAGLPARSGTWTTA